MYISLDDSGRISATSDKYSCDEQMSTFDFPQNFDFSQQQNYSIIDGNLVYSAPPTKKIMPTETDRIAAIEKYLLEKELGVDIDG